MPVKTVILSTGWEGGGAHQMHHGIGHMVTGGWVGAWSDRGGGGQSMPGLKGGG